MAGLGEVANSPDRFPVAPPTAVLNDDKGHLSDFAVPGLLSLGVDAHVG